MNILWARIRSWHALRPGESRTLCGRLLDAGAEVHDTLPAGKSCESCLRVVARRVDA